jgi:Glycosyl hydrolases related to GH101 family, GH129
MLPQFIWTLSNDFVIVCFDEQRRIIAVTDRRCGKTWEQVPFDAELVITGVEQQGNRLVIGLRGEFIFTATVTLAEGAEVVVTLAADASTPMEMLAFPPAFKTPDAGHALVLTDGEGLLLPADDTDYPLGEGRGRLYFCGGGPAMSWMGVTDAALESGYMAILETPYDGGLEAKRADGGLITFSPVWFASMREFGGERTVRYVFFAAGGYVAQCKRYREHIWPTNRVRTLRESVKRFPAIAKILGAVHIYVWDKAREANFARTLKAAGVEKAFLLWNSNHLPYPEKDYDNQVKELGYASGGYQLFTDVHKEDIEMRPLPNPEITFKLNYYPGLFHELAAQNHDGTYYVNQFGHTTNPSAISGEIVKRLDRQTALYPSEGCFVDVYQANGLFECYNPGHRLTRRGYAEAILENLKLIEDRYGAFIGGEWGGDFTGSRSVFAHGMMTLQRTWFDSDILKKGTIYYYGDWANNSRPSQMLGSRTAPDTYLKYSINEATRVPLYELVYHDAIVTSWRWEDCNHHNPEIWWKKDLFNILYGTVPLWSIDQDRWEAYAVSFVESYRKICPWHQQICYDELVAHRFVNAERTVQETRFSSGRRAVVNFGDKPCDFEGQVIAARGFLTFKD